MQIVDLIISLLALSIPPLILLLPFFLAWWRGAKNLQRTHRKYERALKLVFLRLFGFNLEYSIKNPLEAVFEGKNQLAVSGKTFLFDRRFYGYYFARLFGGVNDGILVELVTQESPGCSLIIVPKRRRKLLEKILTLSEGLEVVRIADLDKDYLILTDNILAVQKLINSFIIYELANLKRFLAYLIIDYFAPQMEVYFEINDRNYSELIPRLLTLVKHIMENALKITPRKSKLETIRMLRKSLKLR
ncbi:MAG: hypothetical protein NDP13_04470 [Crenarchaeota archaeon]|nr:hypothetical protein [Thermoproteota archaeon]MCR8454228.1 hypothetical protein [Thermoproteota archaeon]MCR8454740.1 hypothetical protein [Thermoproteota archaeon]MCR8463414.1 hypothetical protein [Thermoproteota archaeon]MCR8470251.1 hypothetical protein [Thermoproteota archaeon]